VIVGGGLAGLAAAVALAGRDLKLTLIESRPRLGGRASSFTDPATGELVDNCQHVSMSCCTSLADFCNRVGTADLFRIDPTLTFRSPEGLYSTLAASKLPAPLHLAASFLRANYLTFGERLRVGYGLMRLRFATGDHPDEPLDAWLRRHGQTTRTIDRYWATVLVSALNERLDRMDVGHARKVFIDGFLRTKDGYRMELPLVPLGELYGSRLEAWLKSREVDVRLTTGVRSVEFDAEGAPAGVLLRTGEVVPAEFVVVAVPFDRVASLLPAPARERLPTLARLAEFAASPITGVHLWFDREVCPVDHLVTVGMLVQWVFNHTALQGRRGAEGKGQYLQIVISASYGLVDRDNASIRDAVLADLATIWPEVNAATLERWRVVTEHGATFAVRPGVDAIRPPQRTAIDGLVLAGDWTATGWPATMEGAVRSGYKAAEAILADLDRPTTLVNPDPPGGRLARLLLGRPAPPRGWKPARAKSRAASGDRESD
jgi:squalene-associated FAD-dependent desaturase